MLCDGPLEVEPRASLGRRADAWNSSWSPRGTRGRDDGHHAHVRAAHPGGRAGPVAGQRQRRAAGRRRALDGQAARDGPVVDAGHRAGRGAALRRHRRLVGRPAPLHLRAPPRAARAPVQRGARAAAAAPAPAPDAAPAAAPAPVSRTS